MYILDCEINIVSNSMKYTSEHDYSLPISCQGDELLWIGTQQELLELAVAIHKSGVIMLGDRKARFIEIVRALADIFHITINDVYVKKTKLLDRCTAVTPFLDKLKVKSTEGTKTRKSESFSPFAKFQQTIFQLITFSYFTKNFLIFPERHPEKCIFQ